MTSNSNIDEILDNLIDNYVERDGSFGLSQLTTNKHLEEVRKIAEQAIQQELLKARIETLEWLLEQEVEFGGLELKQSIIDKVAELQKELKENSDDKTI